jgi:3-hydroxyacyl-CoA dehydrogenase
MTAINDVIDLTRDEDIAVVTVNSPPVNALSANVRVGLYQAFSEASASRSSDIDVVWVKGYGWPAYRGGPMYWADLVGLEKIRDRLRELQQVHGVDFEPAPLLERLAAEGRGFNTL